MTRCAEFNSAAQNNNMPTLESLKQQLLKILAQLNIMRRMSREALYNTAKASLGKDASPNDLAPDELGCAETVSNIIRMVIPTFPIVISTRLLFAALVESNYFKPVDEPLEGDVIISVTGTGNGKVSNGHTGIVGKYGVMSNDSRSGMFLENYTLASWDLYYRKKGGFPTHFFRVV